MKKLIMAAAIVCAAAFAQAANCNWTTYAYDSAMVTALEGGTYWIVSLGTSDAGLSNIKVMTDGTIDLAGNTQIDTGSIAVGSYGSIAGTISGLSASDNGSYYGIVVWDGVTGDGGYFGTASGMVAGIVDAPPTDATPIPFDNSGFGYGATLANTATVAVPEPTSGLLMLIGFAGLALRRRRA